MPLPSATELSVLKDGTIYQEIKKTGSRRQFMDQLLDILRNLGETAMTISKIYTKLRKGSRGQYLLLAFCTFPFGSPDLILRSDVLRADGTEFFCRRVEIPEKWLLCCF